MLSNKPIGGYFEWDFADAMGSFPHSDGVLVNSGHHALQYILQCKAYVKKIFVPYYTCDSVLIPLKVLGIKYAFYHINEKLEISEEIALSENEYLIYTNYFGIKDGYVSSLAKEYGDRLIIDNAQALYANPIDSCNQFYSPRKYVACPDGGIVWPNMTIDAELDKSVSYDKCMSLLKRADGAVTDGLAEFRSTSNQLCNEPLRQMSVLTETMLRAKNYDSICQKRRRNFEILASRLGDSNRFSEFLLIGNCSAFECPMVYPYMTTDESLRQKLIDNKIFVATYWPNVFDWCSPGDLEYSMARDIIPLPIDQRYDEDDMKTIIEIIEQ